jgi:endonuclease/exonuclease/phosphatase family metal-dependent hydrolase
MTMWTRSFVIVLGSMLLAVTAAAAGDHGRDRTVTVMTRNVYHGVDAEFGAIITEPAQLLSRVTDVYLGYHKRIFPARAQALANEIAATQPDLIGLQEAVLIRVDPIPDGPGTPAQVVVLDYLQILLDALEARGLRYEPVVISEGFDPEFPSSLGFDVRHTDREIILVRKERDSALKLSNPRAGHFTVNCTLPLGPGFIAIKRGWVSVDVKVRGEEFRFISTHLDGDCLPIPPLGGSAIQVAQAQELLAGPALTRLPVVLVGDLNSSSVQPMPSAYATLGAAGYADAWVLAGSDSGFTCCQDDFLANPNPQLTERIDLVLFRGNLRVSEIQVVGGTKSASGVWASDHAGVVATIDVR